MSIESARSAEDYKQVIAAIDGYYTGQISMQAMIDKLLLADRVFTSQIFWELAARSAASDTHFQGSMREILESNRKG